MTGTGTIDLCKHLIKYLFLKKYSDNIRRTTIETDRTNATVVSRFTNLDSSKYFPSGSSRQQGSHVPIKLKNDKPFVVDQKEHMLSFEEQEGAPQRYAIPDPTVKEKDKTQERGAGHLKSRPVHMSEVSASNYPNHKVSRSRNFPQQYEQEESYDRPMRIRGDRQQANRIIQRKEPSYSPPQRDEPAEPIQKKIRVEKPNRQFREEEEPVRANRPYRQVREEQPSRPAVNSRPQPNSRMNQYVKDSPQTYTQDLVEDDEDSEELEVDRYIERDPEPHEPHVHAKGNIYLCIRVLIFCNRN